MKPDLDRFFEVAGVHLLLRTAPGLAVGYEQSTTMMLGVMLSAVREEFERAAARRVDENRELRRLFTEAAPVVTAAPLRTRLEQAAAGEEADYAVSALESANGELRGLLIELHAHVEDLATPEARRLEAAIWRELVSSTERRQLSLGPF